MTKGSPALASVPLLTARGLLSLVLGACAFPQNARPPDTLNPSLFQLQHTSWTERDGAPPTINGIAQAPRCRGLIPRNWFDIRRPETLIGSRTRPLVESAVK